MIVKRDIYQFLFIEELTGEQRQIILSGMSMPMQGAQWGMQQRRATKWYPGSSSASMQVLGAEELPTTFSLRLDDRNLAIKVIPKLLGVPLTAMQQDMKTPEEAVELFNSVARAGQELEVEWANRSRRGILARLIETPTHEGLSTLELEFEWRERYRTNYQFDAPQAPTAAATDIFSTIAGLMSKYEAAKEFLDENILSVADSWIKKCNTAASSLIAIMGDVASLPDLADSQIRNAMGVLGNFSQAAFDARLLVEKVNNYEPPQAPTFDYSSSAGGAQATSTDVAKIEEFFAELDASTLHIRETVIGLWWELKNLLEGEDALAVDMAPSGATLWDYAETYYHDRESWQRIAQYNGLTSPRLNGGEIIVVPRLRT